MLAIAVMLYTLLTCGAGLLAARLVKNSKDFIVAGHRLPLGIATFTVFATWFGSETILGASQRAAERGWLGVIEDPLGAALCLILVGLFFARPLYRLNLLTFGDFYRKKYGRTAERIAALCLILSYFGWIAAQLVALGIIFDSLLGWGQFISVIVASALVIAYTYTGGMWAVSVTDTIQSVMIIAGLVIVGWAVFPQLGGVEQMLARLPESHFDFFPQSGAKPWLEYFAAWMTLGLGSIPQQDVFQRVMASKSERVAVHSSLFAGVLYLTVGMIPLLLGIAAVQAGESAAGQMMVPQLILKHTSLPVQIFFYGALVSAIMSTASGAILAPASILSENLIRPLIPDMGERYLLRYARLSVLFTGVVATSMALLRQDVYELVSEASAISFVSLFVPLVCGLWLKRHPERAASMSMITGLVFWAVFAFGISTPVPALFWGGSAGALTFGIIYFFDRAPQRRSDGGTHTPA